MTAPTIFLAAVLVGLGVRIVGCAWRNDPPDHVSFGMAAIIVMCVSVTQGTIVAAVAAALVAGWQFGCAYMRHEGQPRYVVVRFYLDDETGDWLREEPKRSAEGFG
jgi:hypothetical protein